MSSDISHQLQLSYRPVLTVVVYENERRGGGHDDPYYLESHPVDEHGQVLEGRPLQASTLAGIVEVFRDKTEQQAIITGEIPRHLLHFSPTRAGDYTMVWHRPACQKILQFQNNGLKDGPAMVPPMLFIARAKQLQAFALESNRRPSPKTKVWPAPFPNVGASGGVCLGSAKVKPPKDKTFDSLIAYWEDMWWNSRFTHTQQTKDLDIIKLLRAQLRRPLQPYPVARLGETKLTYQSIIHNATKK